MATISHLPYLKAVANAVFINSDSKFVTIRVWTSPLLPNKINTTLVTLVL